MTVRSVRSTVAVLIIVPLLVIAFQNCSKGFQSTDHGAIPLASESLAFSDVQVQASSLSKLEATSDIVFEIASDNQFPVNLVWSHRFKNLAGGCTERNGTQANSYILNCPGSGELEVQLQGEVHGRQSTFPVYKVTLANAPDNGQPQINMTVVFNIPAGTGNQPWNTAATTVETFVGQTLELKNNDTVVHRLHTNGRPFPHGNNIAVGGTMRHVIAQSYNRMTNGVIYDHIAGTSAAFFLAAYDGAQLYSQNCASCHGPLATSEVAQARVSAIQNALTAQPQMQIVPLMSLTRRQIEAISYALGGR